MIPECENVDGLSLHVKASGTRTETQTGRAMRRWARLRNREDDSGMCHLARLDPNTSLL